MKPTLSYLPKDAPASDVISAIERDGAVVLTNALSPADLSELTADCQRELDKTRTCDGVFLGYQTKRVATMVAKSRVCQNMAINPTVLAVMDHFLLPSCDRYQLNLSQLIDIHPGERRQVMHADDPMFPFDHAVDKHVMINVMWCIDDFTAENGATHIVPGSHLWPRDREATDDETLQAECKAGSLFIWLGSTRHGGGANVSSGNRRGIVMSYNLGWLRQNENMYLSVPLDIVRTYPRPLQELIGYFVHKPNLNTVEGRDPIELLLGGDLTARGFKDHMPKNIEELLNKFYQGENLAIARVESDTAVGTRH